MILTGVTTDRDDDDDMATTKALISVAAEMIGMHFLRDCSFPGTVGTKSSNMNSAVISVNRLYF